jgi:sugar-phosphatase
MPTQLVQAVLFDLDGTLIDSTASVNRNWRIVADLMGRPAEDVVGRFHGMPGRQALRLADPTLSDHEVAILNKVLIDGETADTSDVIALPGAVEALAALPAGSWAVVTSCPPRLAKARLAAAGLPFPPTMVTSDDIAHGKPHPDPFLAGAAALGRDPQQCLAVEDAPAGITSAQAAGCVVLGLQTTHTDLDADTVKDLSQVSFTVESNRISVSW